MSVWNSPPLLLILTGSFLGLTFPLGKLANLASISPIVWAWMISFGAGLVLLLIHLLAKKRVCCNRTYLTYYFVSSIFSLVIPNVLIFTVIPKLGSGFTGILFTLSPIFTLLFSSIWQIRIPSLLGIAGIAAGFVGAMVVALTRGEVGQPASVYWILAGLCIPITLAVGNVYRTMAWPKNASPLELAIGSNLSSATILFLVLVVLGDVKEIAVLATAKNLAISQILFSAAMFSVFFRLQQVGGPTYLSQIGFVASGIALLIGTLFLNEQYSVVTWLGTLFIIVGIVLGIVAQRRRSL